MAALGVTLPRWVIAKAATLHGSLAVGLGALALATVFWTIMFARPGRRRRELAAVNEHSPDRPQWLRATAISLVTFAALFALARIRPAGRFGTLCAPAIVVIAAATLADLLADARAYRHPNLTPVWPLHDPLLVDAARELLGDIPHVIQGTRLRTLLWLFGSFAPMTVLVPAPRAAEAHDRLAAWLTPPDRR